MTRLVTIDADHPGVQFFIKEWAPVCSGLSDRTTAATAVYIRDQIAAQTRIPEPIEALAEVTAHTQLNTERRKFVRGYVGGPTTRARWVDGITAYGWPELIDPTLIREGLS
jgi:hypothetical protein